MTGQEISRPVVEFTFGPTWETHYEDSYSGIQASAGLGLQVSQVLTVLCDVGYSNCLLERQRIPYSTFDGQGHYNTDTARLFHPSATSIRIGATIKVRLIPDSSAIISPFFQGSLGGYDAWITSLDIGNGMNDIIVSGSPSYFGVGVGIDFMMHRNTTLFIELLSFSGQSNYPELSLITASIGTRTSF
jgi:hypothetical protein